MAGNKQTNKLMKFSRRLNFGAGTLAGIGITGITSQLFSLEGDEDFGFWNSRFKHCFNRKGSSFKL